jgi:hypothetical protein
MHLIYNQNHANPIFRKATALRLSQPCVNVNPPVFKIC